MTPDGLSLVATLKKITTTVDGGWSITFDVPDSESMNILQLAQLRDRLLQLGAVPVPQIFQEAE